MVCKGVVRGMKQWKTFDQSLKLGRNMYITAAGVL